MLEQLAELFKRFDYRWLIGDERRVPTEDDLSQTLDTAAKRLYDEGNGAQLEVGRLLIRKLNDKTTEVYLYIGDYNE